MPCGKKKLAKLGVVERITVEVANFQGNLDENFVEIVATEVVITAGRENFVFGAIRDHQ